MTVVDADLYLVEHRLPRITVGELELLQAALNEACSRLTARGEPVSYLGSTFLPESARLLSLFKAGTADSVRSVSASSQAPMTHLEAAIDLPAPDF